MKQNNRIVLQLRKQIVYKLLIFSTLMLLISCSNTKSKEVEFYQEIKDLEGFYENPMSKKSISYNEIIIKYLGGRKVSFLIEVGRIAGCTGEIDGEVYIDSTFVVNYSAIECDTLRITFLKDKIKIEEYKCLYHGAFCYFVGEYIKMDTIIDN